MTESVRIYEALRNDIILCELAPGTPVSEAELCSRYKSGRAPVREACRRLQDESLVTIVPFRGYFIAPLTIEEYRNLREAQLVIEPEVAALAAHRATESQIRRIESLAEYEYYPGQQTSYYKFLEVNREFHGEIAAAGENEILHDAVTNLHVRLIRYFYKVISMDSYGKELVDEHRDIAKAIRNRQSEKAGEMARRHLQKTNERSAKLSFGLPGWTGQAALTPSLDNGAGGTKRRRRVL